MRKIKFKLLTQVQLETIETSVRTFGELRNLIETTPELNSKISFQKKTTTEGGVTYEETLKFIEKNTLAEFGKVDEALLPAGDCLFFVTPLKTKSGADLKEIEEVEEMGYNELRSYGSALNRENNANIDLSGKRADMLTSIVEYLQSQEVDENEIMGINAEDIEDPKELLKAAVGLIVLAIGKLSIASEDSKYADGITYEELQLKAIELKELLNS